MNMTLALPHGENSRPEFLVYDKDVDILTLQAFYHAYQVAADGYYGNWWDFARQVRNGHILLISITEEDYRSCLGIELMRDKKGPYINPIFYAGHLTRRLIRDLVWYLYQVLQHYKEEERYQGYGRLYLGGRPGWQAVAYRLGFTIDHEDFVSENQEVLRHGLLKRLQ